jgi:hypothetical protein
MRQNTEFKAALDKITYDDVLNLRACENSKTISLHLERIKKGKFEKSEINALTKLFSGSRFTTPERKLELEAFQSLTMDCVDQVRVFSNIYGDVMHFKKPMRIMAEQTLTGKAWLKNFFFKKNGEKRNSKNTEYVSDRVLAISKNVSRFEFIGIVICKNPHGGVNNVLPVYRTYNRKGEYFDYSPIHWGQPVIMEGY